MLKKTLQIATTFMATTLVTLTVQSSASALDFTFSFSDGTNNVTGIIEGLTEGTSSPTSVRASSTFLGWNDLAFDIPRYGASSFTFEVVGGQIVDDNFLATDGADNFLYLDGDSSTLAFLPSYYSQNVPDQTVTYDPGFFDGTVYTAVPVPFGVSPNTGLGILAGIWGISRLRKITVARKSFK